MANFRVLYGDGSTASKTKVSIAVDYGGMAYGVTDSLGYVSIVTNSNNGKIIIGGRTVWHGSLNVSEVRIR